MADLRHSGKPETGLGTGRRETSRLLQYALAAVPFILALAAGIPNLLDYIVFDFNLILGLIAIPILVKFQPRKKAVYWRFGIISGVFLLLHYLLHIKIPFFMGWGFLLMFLAENQLGKIGWMPVWLLFLLSPVQSYISQVAGASLRMQLSSWAGSILQIGGMDVTVDGNRFTLGESGEVFFVDPACAGLGMLLTGWIFMLLFIGFQESTFSRKMNLFTGSILMLGAFGGVVIANLFRIIGIVMFRLPPETIGHELLGIVSLIIYCVIPIWFLAKGGVRWMGKPVTYEKRPQLRPLAVAPACVAAGLIIVLGIFTVKSDHLKNTFGEGVPVEVEIVGFDKKVEGSGIVQFLSDQSLIYIKPPANYWGADHNPGICWRAGGYSLRGESTRSACNQQVMVAELQSDSTVLYTAWWYDNGASRTASQWEWRRRAFNGEPGFALVNVTVNQQEDLLPEVERIMGICKLPQQ